MTKKIPSKAFSLIELSIVVLIIGIVVAGITQSSRLIEKMAVNSARSLTTSSPVSGMRDLVAWYESTSEASFASSVDPDSTTLNAVSAWNDINPTSTTKCNLSTTQSSNGLTAAAAPVLRRRAMGNLPAVLFDGVASYLSCDALASYFNGGDKPMSIFVVSNFNAFPTQSIPVSFSNSATANPVIWVRSTSANVAHFSYRISGTPFYSTDAPLSVNTTTMLSYIVGGGAVTSYFNGNGGSPITPQAITNYGTTMVLNQFSVGATTRVTPGSFFSGFLGEVIIFNRALTSEEVSSIHGYLSKKWGIKT